MAHSTAVSLPVASAPDTFVGRLPPQAITPSGER